jgi:hypothetical protein
MANYNVIRPSLAVANDRLQIVDDAKPFDGFTVVGIPGGTVAWLHVGENADPIPVLGLGFSLCFPPETRGLFLTNQAGAGTLDILVSYNNVTPGA